MGHGMYTAPSRVVRDGRVVCFKGEVMTVAEAERRGLARAVAPCPEPDPAPAAPETDPAAVRELVKGNTAAELRALAAEVGAEYPDGANKTVVAEAIVAARGPKAAG